jgi:hypothetical protein
VWEEEGEDGFWRRKHQNGQEYARGEKVRFRSAGSRRDRTGAGDGCVFWAGSTTDLEPVGATLARKPQPVKVHLAVASALSLCLRSEPSYSALMAERQDGGSC